MREDGRTRWVRQTSPRTQPDGGRWSAGSARVHAPRHAMNRAAQQRGIRGLHPNPWPWLLPWMAPDARPTLLVFHAPHVQLGREQPLRGPRSQSVVCWPRPSYHKPGATKTFHWSPKSEITAIEPLSYIGLTRNLKNDSAHGEQDADHHRCQRRGREAHAVPRANTANQSRLA